MQQGKNNKIWLVVKLLFYIYVGAGLIAFLVQDLLIFHPTRLPPNHKFVFSEPFTELNIKVSEGRNVNIIKFSSSMPAKGLVLFFHGNMRNIERYAGYATLLTKRHYDIWMIDYPGFGKSTGKATEQNMYADAVMLYNMAGKTFAPIDIIIYGKSLGTGVASYLSAQRRCKNLILETPYYSMKDLARHYLMLYPTNLLIKYSFPTNEHLKLTPAPVTIFHGTEDEVIPYKQSIKLAAENPSVELVTIENGKHNNLSQFPLFAKKLDSALRIQ